MTLEDAKKIADAVQGWGWGYEPGDDTVCLDDHFTPEQLEAIAMLVRADQAARAAHNTPQEGEGR